LLLLLLLPWLMLLLLLLLPWLMLRVLLLLPWSRQGNEQRHRQPESQQAKKTCTAPR
jgi:hypothetical protein